MEMSNEKAIHLAQNLKCLRNFLTTLYLKPDTDHSDHFLSDQWLCYEWDVYASSTFEMMVKASTSLYIIFSMSLYIRLIISWSDLEKVVNRPQAENSELYKVLKIA